MGSTEYQKLSKHNKLVYGLGHCIQVMFTSFFYSL